MVPFEQLIQPRPGHGLQAMMRRWEELHPVNAVHIVQLAKPLPARQIQAAADRVLARLLDAACTAGTTGAPADPANLFDFECRLVMGDWRKALEQVVTQELNAPFDDGRSPFRIRLIELNCREQFLIFVYRHVIADARAVALLIQELLNHLVLAGATVSGREAILLDSSLPELFPAEFGWCRRPVVAWHLLREWWQSRRCVRLHPASDSDLQMEFQIHDSALPLPALKQNCRRLGVTVNDLFLAAVLEWFAARLPRRGTWKRDLAVATLVDISQRAAPPQSRAFGQFVSQFVVREPVREDWSFEEIVARVATQTARLKQNGPLIDNSLGFEFLSRLWDWLPFVRHPRHLARSLPLLAGVSNVNLSAIAGPDGWPPLVRRYYRGTCVTNLLPVMVTITSLGDTLSLTTTHRTACFSVDDVRHLAAHIARRLVSAAAGHVEEAPTRRVA